MLQSISHSNCHFSLIFSWAKWYHAKGRVHWDSKTFNSKSSSRKISDPCSTVRHRLLKTKVILQVYRKEPIYIVLLRPNVINVCSLGRWYLKPLCSFMNGYYYNMVSCSGEFRTTYCHSVCFIWWVSEWLTDWLFCILESPEKIVCTSFK